MHQSGYEAFGGFETQRYTDEGCSSAPASARFIGADTPDSEDDRDWVARVRGGDEDAAQALVERLYPTILKSVAARLQRHTSREDVLQMVFARIFHNLGQFAGRAPLEHWASRIAVNTCINVGRSHARRHEMPWDDLTDSEKEHAQFSLAGQSACNAQESNELVQQLLARLSPDERQVITLLHLEERSTREISQLTGWPVSTVKVKAFRTRRKMQKLWRGLKRAENGANRSQ